jgi:hypothetical protein
MERIKTTEKDVEIKEVLEDFKRETELRQTWLEMWESLGTRILKLPKWMQTIVLEDINTAIKNRVATMEMIENANTKNKT